MKKIIASLLLASQLSLASTAIADDAVSIPAPPPPVSGEIDVGAAISPMKKGQVAPFTGVLLSPKALATIVVQLNTVPDQIKIEVDKTKAEDKANCDFNVAETKNRLETDKKILQAEVDSANKRVNILSDIVKQQEASKSNNGLTTGLVGVGGVLVGIGATVLAVFALGAAK